MIFNKKVSIIAGLLLAGGALAQSDAQFPLKPIRMIVPSAPGSGPDIMARAIGQKLTELLGQPIVIDDKPGAGGIIGSEAAAKSAPDGYTLIMSNAGAHAVNASLYAKLPYDPVRDFAPVTLVSMAPNILIVHPTLPARNVKELIALAKAKPGEMTFGSGGTGSTAHLSGEMFKSHGRHRHGPRAVQGFARRGHRRDLGADHNGVSEYPPALPLVRSGKLKALAVTTANVRPLCRTCRRSPNRACPATRRRRGSACLHLRRRRRRSSRGSTRRSSRSCTRATCRSALPLRAPRRSAIRRSNLPRSSRRHREVGEGRQGLRRAAGIVRRGRFLGAFGSDARGLDAGWRRVADRAPAQHRFLAAEFFDHRRLDLRAQACPLHRDRAGRATASHRPRGPALRGSAARSRRS